MSGFRGIFLDSIHPLIVKRLDADTHAFKQMAVQQKQGPESERGDQYEYASTSEAFKYFSERMVWMRVVPFAIPQTQYTLNPNYVFGNLPAGDPSAKTFINADMVSQYMVPQWRDWVIWGHKSANIHGGIYSTTGVTPVKSYGGAKDNQGEYHSSNMFGWGGKHGQYRRTNTAWDGTSRDGVINSPIPGLTNLAVSNKGDLGTIRRASFDIKCHSLMDVEAIEMMYMVPGLSVLVEWGWYHPKLYIEPIDIERIKSGDKLASTNTINTEILKKSFGISEPTSKMGDPRALYNLEEQANKRFGPLGPAAGIYDGLLGISTKFSWTNDGMGGYDCRVDCISPGSLAGGIPAESYNLGGSETVEKQEIPVTDLRTIIAMVKKETRTKENNITNKHIEENSQSQYDTIELIDNDVEGNVLVDGKSIEDVNVPGHKLKTGEYGIKIEEKDGKLVYTKTEATTDGSGDYFVGEYKGGKDYRQTVSKVYGDRTWWNRLIGYCWDGGWRDGEKEGIVDSSNWFGSNPTVAHCESKFKHANCDKIMDTAGMNEQYTLGNMEVHWGDAFRDGNFYVTGTDRNIYVKINNQWIDRNTSWSDNMYMNASNYFFPWKVDVVGWPGMEDPHDSKNKELGDRDILWNVQAIDGYTTGKSAKNDYSWTEDDNGGYIDRSGNQVVGAGSWGSNDYDPIVVTSYAGSTVYKREKNDDDTYTYTEVASIEGVNAADIAETVKAKAADINADDMAARKKEVSDKVKKDAAITAAASNIGAVTWANPGGKIVAFDTANYHSGIYAKAYPQFAPPLQRMDDGTLYSSELGYELIKGKKGWMYPIGAVAYSETYLSWRFVEDYLLNELYMPRAVQPGKDENNDPKIALDTTFLSANRCSDKEKVLLMENFLNKFPGLVEKSSNGTLTDDSRDRELYHSQHIINHPNLRSFNPEVCILPGQEHIPKTEEMKALSQKQKEKKEAALEGDEINLKDITGTIKGKEFLLDNMSNKDASPNIQGRGCLNRFAGYDSSGNQDYTKGTLRNIMVNSNLLEEAAAKSPNVRKFVMTVLDKINKACGEPWKFKLLTNSALGKMSVIDENYTPASNVSSYGQGYTYMDTGDGGVNSIGVYKFPGIGSDNILKGVKIQSKIPSELQSMAYYSTLGSNNDKGSEVQMFNMYRAGIVDRLRSISSVTVLGNQTGSQESMLQAEAKLILSYAELLGTTRKNITIGAKTNESIGEGESVAKTYVRKYVHGDTVTVGGYRPPIPIDVSLSLHGVSGIYMGNAIMIKTIDEGGLLPSRYRSNVALQATSVDHTISPEGWTTDIGTLMRPLPDAQYKPTMKVSIKRVAPASMFEPGDLPIGNPFGSGKQYRVSSQFGNQESFRKSTHGGLDVAADVGTPYYCCLPKAKISFRKQTGTNDATDSNGNKLANTNGYGYYVRLKGKGFGGTGSKTKFQIDYAHCEGFVDPNGDGTVMDFEEMKAYGESKGWDTGDKHVSVPGTVDYGQPVGTCGGTDLAKGAGNSGGPHLHLAIKIGGVLQDPQLMVDEYYVAEDGEANDHFKTGGKGA